MVKEKKSESTMDKELRAMKRVAAAINGLEFASQRRVLNYVEQQIPWPDDWNDRKAPLPFEATNTASPTLAP